MVSRTALHRRLKPQRIPRKPDRHQAWMTRAYALALGAGTQVLTQGIGNAVFGTGALATDLSLGAGWVINLAVAEYVIRRPWTGRINTITAQVESS